MPSPITSQAARNAGRECASARARRPIARSPALTASTGRPPRSAMARPTHGEMTPAVSRPSDRPPTTQANDQPVSATIGAASTAGR